MYLRLLPVGLLCLSLLFPVRPFAGNVRPAVLRSLFASVGGHDVPRV